MHHDERSYSVAAVMGERTTNNTYAEGVVVQMQCWEKGPAIAWMQRELPYGCSSRSGSGRAMGNSARCSSAEDVGGGGLAST